MGTALQLNVNNNITIQHLPITRIRTDGGIQSRAHLNEEVSADYAEAMSAGATFPPVLVFYDGKDYWLADGFHRIHAARKAELIQLAVEVRQGSQREALLCSMGANANHGLRRTNADKQRAVKILLRDKEWGQWSDNAIAKACGVSQPFVGKVRSELFSTYNGFKSGRKSLDGRTVNTTNIGSKTNANQRSSQASPADVPMEKQQPGEAQSDAVAKPPEDKLPGKKPEAPAANSGDNPPKGQAEMEMPSLIEIGDCIGSKTNANQRSSQASPADVPMEKQQPGEAQSDVVVKPPEDKLPGKKPEAPAANSGDDPPKGQAEMEMPSLIEIGDRICLTGIEQQECKWFGEVAKVKELTATDTEVTVKISHPPNGTKLRYNSADIMNRIHNQE